MTFTCSLVIVSIIALWGILSFNIWNYILRIRSYRSNYRYYPFNHLHQYIMPVVTH